MKPYKSFEQLSPDDPTARGALKEVRPVRGVLDVYNLNPQIAVGNT